MPPVPATGFGEATIWAKVSFVLIILSNVCNFIAFGTTSWGIADVAGGDDYHTGLWRRCRTTTLGCDYLDGYGKVWVGVVQGFACIGFAGVNAVMVLVVCYIYTFRCVRDREVSAAAGFTALITAGCWLVAVITFGVQYEDDADVSATATGYADRLSYSFAMAVITFVTEALVGGIMLIECFYKRGRKQWQKHNNQPF